MKNFFFDPYDMDTDHYLDPYSFKEELDQKQVERLLVFFDVMNTQERISKVKG